MTSRVRRTMAAVLSALVAAPPTFAADRQRSSSQGSVRSVNREPGSGGSWSNRRTSGTTSRTTSGNTSSRTTQVEGRYGGSATGTRDVTKEGDSVTVDRTVTGSQGQSVTKQKEYELEDGRVESVERNVQATDKYGRTAEYEGKAERQGAGWTFEGEGENRYGQDVDVEGAAVRGPYGTRAVADIDGGRYGDRTVAAWKPYGGPTWVSRLPPGYTNYPVYGRPYYRYGGVYYRPVGGIYYVVPPPYGYCCYTSSDMAAAVMLTMVGMTLLYKDGVYYEKAYVQGLEQYKVVPAPAGATLPQGAVPPADAATVTTGGTTYYYYANTFYKVAPKGNQMGFVVVEKPAGVQTLTALPADIQPKQAGTLTYLVSGGKHYMPYLDTAGREQYIVVDPPPGQPKAAVAATATRAVPLTLPAGTPLTVRLTAEISSGTHKAGDRFQGNLDHDLVAGGQLVATRGARAYGRVAQAQAGTGMGGAPVLALELTDLEVGGRVVPVATGRVQAQGEAKKPGKKILGGAALGAGIGAAIDGGEGAAWGAGIGAVAGTAAAKSSPGNQVAFGAGSAIEFRTAQPVTVEKQVTVQAPGD